MACIGQSCILNSFSFKSNRQQCCSLQHMQHVITKVLLWFVGIIQSVLVNTNNSVLKLRSRNNNLSCHPALQHKLSMGMTAHILWDTSTGCVTKFSSDWLWLYNQYRAPLMTHSHSQSTLCAVDCAMCLMCPTPMSFANQTDFYPGKLFQILSGLFFPSLTNQPPCGG